MVWTCRARDAAGRIIFDGNERLARQIDAFDTGTTAGSRSYNPEGGGISFMVCAPFSVFYDGPAVDLDVNTNTISWNFSSNPTTGYSVKILVWAF